MNNIENNIQKYDNDSNYNVKFFNKIGFNDTNEVENNNSVNNTKEKLLNERINYFKSKFLNNLEKEQYDKAYNYLVKMKKIMVVKLIIEI